jgi:hypothetical protein
MKGGTEVAGGRNESCGGRGREAVGEMKLLLCR